jgi:hypothetical protein
VIPPPIGASSSGAPGQILASPRTNVLYPPCAPRPYNVSTRSDPTSFAGVKEVANMGRIRSVVAVAVLTVAMLAASALPAAADSFGPAFFCDAQAFTNCTDTSNPALAEDTFSCEGALRDVVSCTTR